MQILETVGISKGQSVDNESVLTPPRQKHNCSIYYLAVMSSRTDICHHQMSICLAHLNTKLFLKINHETNITIKVHIPIPPPHFTSPCTTELTNFL